MKKPRVGVSVEQVAEQNIAWHIRIIDRGGPWCWTSIDAPTLWEILHSKLANYETMKWSEILGQRNHGIKVSRLAPDARKRLEAIRQDDVEELYSLHLDGKKRIWGIRQGNILKVLWWDSDHQVCPSLQKHT